MAEQMHACTWANQSSGNSGRHVHTYEYALVLLSCCIRLFYSVNLTKVYTFSYVCNGYIQMRIYIYVCTYTFVCVCTHTHIFICVYTHTHICMRVYIHNTHTCMYTCMYIYDSVCLRLEIFNRLVSKIISLHKQGVIHRWVIHVRVHTSASMYLYSVTVPFSFSHKLILSLPLYFVF